MKHCFNEGLKKKNRKLDPSAEIPNNNPGLVGGGSYSSEQIVVWEA